MSPQDIIRNPIKQEMDNFNNYFRSYMKSKAPLLDIITKYILKHKGKQMRPMFVFLSAKLAGEINKSTYNAAGLIELLHTATLVHDDVVDESYKRRGFFSINALWKNKISVLVGDYLLSKGLLLAVDNKEFDLLQIVSEAVKEMSEGELLQIEKARKLNITENIYFDIIRKKTAALIAACTASGVKSAGADDEKVKLMHTFGELVGISFQIKDDLFDYSLKSSKIGKPTGIDIKEKKLTLPLIYALKKSSEKEQKRILQIINKHNEKKRKVKEVIKFVHSKGGMEYAQNKMLEYKNKALEILNIFPDNEAKISLREMVSYTVNRDK